MALSADQQDQLLAYAALVEKWNKTFNLVSRQDIKRLLPRHLLDSLAGAALLNGQQILDLGSGAGLPGVPLAISAPERSFMLLDRSSRRVRFLQQVARNLSLHNVEVVEGDFAQVIGPGDLYDTVTARGVTTGPEVWAMVGRNISATGRVLVYESTQMSMEEDEQSPVEPNQTDSANVTVERHVYSVAGLEHNHSILIMAHA
ncbi:MAG: 16S rRNA (guanine(527)-N(7))-methyltransferase RsmG [Pseudomonadaceae bacterium]|nr:16S rRNA (guanine(527)-N(7))-methyltransferase RsmG [Pseudomonadaceae bacterium]